MRDDTGSIPTVPMFDLVMGVPVPTLQVGADEQRAAFAAAQEGTPGDADPACAGDGTCPACGDTDPGPFDHDDPCRVCGHR